MYACMHSGICICACVCVWKMKKVILSKATQRGSVKAPATTTAVHHPHPVLTLILVLSYMYAKYFILHDEYTTLTPVYYYTALHTAYACIILYYTTPALSHIVAIRHKVTKCNITLTF